VHFFVTLLDFLRLYSIFISMKTSKITPSITNRETESFDKYLKDIYHKPLITPQREVELANLIKEGNKRAENELVEANLRFVVSIAKQYQNRGLEISDLVSEGNIGLIKAAQKFDSTKGIKFISYAVWWIRQSILQSLADNSRMIRLPLNQIGSLNRIRECQMKLEQELNREATPEELAEALGLEESKIMHLLTSKPITSLDKTIGSEEEGLTLLDTISSGYQTDEVLEVESIKTEISSLLTKLSEKERLVIELSFGLSGKSEMTLSEISDIVGVGKERIRQIKNSALSKLR
jgi:RNA polymerase primary sigma factor